MAITGASLQPIYDRLNSIAKYHPVSAETFSDWSLEAGDIVTIAREETEYEGPVHSTRIVWRGSPQVTINSTGKQERDSIAKTSKRKYGRSGAGMYGNQALYHDMYSEDGKLHSELLHTESVLRVEFENEISSVWSEFEITASHLEAEFTDQVNSLRGEFEITASRLEAEFTDDVNSLRGELVLTASILEATFEDDMNSLRGEFEITASRLYTEFTDDINSLRGELVLTASILEASFTDDVNSLRSDLVLTASILEATFEDDMNSLRGEFEITASRMYTEFTDDINSLRGELEITASGLYTEFTDEIGSVRSEMVQTASSWDMRVSGVVDENGNVTAASITASINDSQSTVIISADHINLNGYVKATDITADLITSKLSLAQSVSVQRLVITSNGGSIKLPTPDGNIFISGSDAVDIIRGIKVVQNGNTYNLQAITYGEPNWHDLPNSTFSRATTLTGAWGSGADADKFIVEAQPQGNQYKYSPPLRLNGSTQYANFSAEITERTGSTVVAKKSVYGYLIAGGTGTGSYVRVNTANDGSGVNVAQLNIGSLLEDNVTFTTNGTKTPDPGYIGFGSVNIDVQSTPVTPSISYTWGNGGLLTVTTSPAPQSDLVRQLRQGTTSWSGTTATVQVLAEYGSQGQYTEDTNFTATVDAEQLATNAGYLGRAAVGLTDPTWATAPSASVTSNSNTATISTTGRTNASGTTVNLSKTVPIYMTQGDWDTSTNKKYVYAHVTNSSDANRIARLEVNAGTIYSNGETAGKNAVTITKGSWSGGQISFTKSEGTASTKSVQLTAAPASWNGNTASVAIWDGTAADAQHGVNTGYTVTVNASTLVTNAGYAGRAAVTLVDPSWNAVSGTLPANRTVTVSTTGRTNASGTTANLSKSVALYLTQGTWSSNKLVVSMRTGSTSGTAYAQTTVDAGTLVTNAGYAGRASVTLVDPSWNAVTGTLPANRTVTVSTTGRTNSSGTTENLSKSVALYLTQGTWSSNKLTVSMRAGSSSGTAYAQSTVDASTLVSNATTSGWNSGYDTAKGYVSMPTSAGSSGAISIKSPNAARTGQDTRTYTLTNNGNNEVILYTSVNSSNVTVAKITHNKWNSGYDTARGYVSMPTSAGTGSTITIKSPNSARSGQDSRSYALANNGDDEVILYTSVNSSNVTVAKFTHNKYTAGFNAGIVAVRQSYNSSNRYVDMVYNGAWTGVTGYYIGDMLDAAAAGVTISSIGTTVGNMDDDTANTYTYTYNATPNPGWYMTLKAKATASNGKYGNANVSFRVQRFANALYGSGWDACRTDAHLWFNTDTGAIYRPSAYGTGGEEVWCYVTDYGWSKGSSSPSVSYNSTGFADSTNNLPGGTKSQQNAIKTAIVNYRSQRGYNYIRIKVNSSYYVYYWVNNGNGWTS